MNLLTIFFSWPNGAVWGNLVAQVMWSGSVLLLAYYRIRHHQKAHHLQVMNKLNAIHASINRSDHEQAR